VSLFAIALVLAARLLWTADWGRAGQLLGRVSPGLPLLPLPFLVGMAIDTVAWRSILRRLGSVVSYPRLLRLRLASEVVTLSVPAGSFGGEALKTLLVSRDPRVRATDAMASVARKKVLYLAAHGAYLTLGFLLGGVAIARLAAASGQAWLPAAYGRSHWEWLREHTTRFFWDQPERFRIGNVTWETGQDLSMSHRFTVDYPEDYALIARVYEALHGVPRPFSLGEILQFLDAHPKVFALNLRYAGVNWYRQHLGELRTVSRRETVVLEETR
jgi:hypothetical protein